MSRATLLALALLAITGCSSALKVDVAYPEAGVNRALLAGAGPRQVALEPVSDRRVDTRIGTEPKKGKPIVTRRPVTDIVRDALALEIERNGHTLVKEPTDLVLAAGVEAFTLDIVEGYQGRHYIGKVAIALTATEGPTGRRLLDRRYVGIKRLRPEGDVDTGAVARAVLDAALTRAMRDLATDRELVKVLARPRSAAVAP